MVVVGNKGGIHEQPAAAGDGGEGEQTKDGPAESIVEREEERGCRGDGKLVCLCDLDCLSLIMSLTVGGCLIDNSNLLLHSLG